MPLAGLVYFLFIDYWGQPENKKKNLDYWGHPDNKKKNLDYWGRPDNKKKNLDYWRHPDVRKKSTQSNNLFKRLFNMNRNEKRTHKRAPCTTSVRKCTLLKIWAGCISPISTTNFLVMTQLLFGIVLVLVLTSKV